MRESRGQAGGQRGNFDAKALKAAVAHIDQQLEFARANAAKIDERHREYDELETVLRDLPEKLTHPIMVPFGPLAFFEGHLHHTNEVLVQLSSEWFVERTAKSALGTVARRKARVNADKADVAKEIGELSKRRQLAAGEGEFAEPANVPGVPGASVRVDDDGFFDIREPVEEDDDGMGPITPASASGAASQAAAAPAPAATGEKSALERLRELERLEEMEDNDDDDEMDELDRITQAAENQGSSGGSGASSAPGGPSAGGAAAVRSPADLFQLMKGVDQGVGAASAGAPAPPPTAAARAGAAKAATGDLAKAPPDFAVASGAFSGMIRESAGASAGLGAGSEAHASATPGRVSKFKADRLRNKG